MPPSSFILDAGAILVMWASYADGMMERIWMEAKEKASSYLAAKLDSIRRSAAAHVRSQMTASLDSMD